MKQIEIMIQPIFNKTLVCVIVGVIVAAVNLFVIPSAHKICIALCKKKPDYAEYVNFFFDKIVQFSFSLSS